MTNSPLPEPDPMRCDLSIVGPFEDYRVSIGGYEVPGVNAREIEHGTKLSISVDHRFGLTIPIEHGQSVMWLLANAMAVAAGYSCHGAHSVYRPNPYKIQMVGIGSVTDADGNEHQIGDGDVS